MKNMLYQRDNTFMIYQPLFRDGVVDYEDRMVLSPSQMLFYRFYMPEQYGGEGHMVCVPDGCIDFVFIVGSHRRLVEIIGSVQKPKVLATCPGSHYFGVRCKPGMFISLEDISLSESMDREIFLRDPQGPCRPFMDRLGESCSLDEMIRLFFDAFGGAITDRFISDTTGALLCAINSHRGALGVEELAEMSGYSPRSLRRITQDQLNLSPKRLCRIVRFQHALHEMLLHPDTFGLSQILALEYADQAHFQREFKAFTGYTPRQFLEKHRSMQW